MRAYHFVATQLLALLFQTDPGRTEKTIQVAGKVCSPAVTQAHFREKLHGPSNTR